MNLLEKLKETAVSVLPVMAIVVLLGLTVAHLDGMLLARFAIGGFLLIIGLTVFLAGVDLGIQPMGERIGAELTKKRKLWLLLLCAFVIGFLVTVAEPDIQVFGDQVRSVFSSVNKNIFVFVIAGGVGLFMLIGLLRTVLNASIKLTLLILYLVIFILMIFVPEDFVGVAFDSGGATTGPMTVPFILALGLGVSSVTKGDKESFGLTGITSVGPVLAVLAYSFVVYRISPAGGAMESGAETLESGMEAAGLFSLIAQNAGHVLKESLLSILPLVFLFFVFQIFLLKMTARQVIRMIIGLVYSLAGLYIFLLGVNGGFMQAGRELGLVLGRKASELGGFWFFLLIFTGLVFGAVVVCAEPAVWVLTEQVESVSGGTIKRKVLLVFLSTGAACAIGLAMVRAVCGFSLRYILIPGYALSLLLMIFSPALFTGIAFDSGGVASGPITSTFVLSFALGAAGCANPDSNDVFGVIALVAMTPLIAIQILGIIFQVKRNRDKKSREHRIQNNIGSLGDDYEL